MERTYLWSLIVLEYVLISVYHYYEFKQFVRDENIAGKKYILITLALFWWLVIIIAGISRCYRLGKRIFR